MATYRELQAKIAQLHLEAGRLKATERAQAIGTVRDLIAAFELTAQELGLARGGQGRPAKAKAKATRPERPGAGVPKYRDPKTGKTWTGHGRAPTWLATTRNRDAFLIDAQPAAEASAPRAARKQAPAKAAKPAVRHEPVTQASSSRKGAPRKAIAQDAPTRAAPTAPARPEPGKRRAGPAKSGRQGRNASKQGAAGSQVDGLPLAAAPTPNPDVASAK